MYERKGGARMRTTEIVRCLLMAVALLVATTIFLSETAMAPAPQPISPVQKEIMKSLESTKNKTMIKDMPNVRKFSLTPHFWLVGQSGTAIFRWIVDPGPGGSRIIRVTISKTQGNGPGIDFSSPNRTGERTLTVSAGVSEGRTTYALTAVNEEGNTATATLYFEVKNLDWLKEQISITRVGNYPPEVPEGSGAFDYVVQVMNRSQATVSGVTIELYRHGVLSGSGQILGKLDNQTIRPGTNEYRVRDTHGIHFGIAYRAWDSSVYVLTQGERDILKHVRITLELIRTVNIFKVRIAD